MTTPAEAVPRRCRGCGWPLITVATFRRCPDVRATHRPTGAHGMCRQCYQRARYVGTVPNPAPAGRRGRHALDPSGEHLAGASVRLSAAVERAAALTVCHLSAGDVQNATVVLDALGLLPIEVERRRSA